MTDYKLFQHEKEERFVCIACAFIYTTNIYSDEEPFRKYQNKIYTKCPRCGTISYKPIDIEKSKRNENDIGKYSIHFGEIIHNKNIGENNNE